jgi:hypothetical protein
MLSLPQEVYITAIYNYELLIQVPIFLLIFDVNMFEVFHELFSNLRNTSELLRVDS